MKELRRITSRENSLIKTVASLQSDSRARKEHGLFVLEGLRLCRDAVLNGFPVDTFIVSDAASQKFASETQRLLSEAKRSYIVPDALFKKIADTVNPQGFLCLCPPPAAGSEAIKADGVYIALENVADPANIGAVARTAEALGLDGLLVSDGACDPFGPKALRASMGALLRIPVLVLRDLTATAHRAGLTTFAAVVDRDAVPLGDAGFSKGCAVFIGNEANGLTAETAACCDRRITIPMAGRAESLNAAAAASIIMWEMCRQI